jgi:hypothetical protein
MGNMLKMQTAPQKKGKSETRMFYYYFSFYFFSYRYIGVFDSKSIEERVLESTPLLEGMLKKEK